ncbi:hypothetical protein [Prochlorococcus marinus]|uniref:Glycosyltransferase RgtA/B/C/D-like domain-containing protein n=1 Tax=Prochlorococcus marinus XMU1408 TaxID=2213228 RepID=A0A318RAF3_PROMR|nr:hypothetical protein [Prochlorococcus marinus]MBW3041765.1 hypothetical protein [Prochlorococcus marinus str. XMU1408]PYE02909.1 hypothetical protein DNJ73_03945 [Prochlorococcus marinus XMU1408]
MEIKRINQIHLPAQRFYEITVPILFILIGLFAAFNHALWRDEMQGWLVAWQSDNLIDLWKNNAPSGHPVLWSLLIYFSKNLTGTPLSMQLMHWLLGSSAIIIFWRYSPFNLITKSLFTFGYFPFWEYYFVCRHYVIAELIIFIFCSIFHLKNKTYIPFSLCIGLLANTQALSWSLAFAIGVTLIFDWFFNINQRINYMSNKNWIYDLITSFVISISLLCFGAFSLLQVRDSVKLLSSFIDVRHLFRVIGQIFGGYILIIPDSSRFIDLGICALITFILLVSTISFINFYRPALIFFSSGITFLFLFNYFLFLGDGSRHYGYYFLFIISSVWLALSNKDKQRAFFNKSNIFTKGNLFYFPRLLTFCLTIHMVVGIHMVINDFLIPYSSGKETAEYIQNKGWQDFPIFATRDVEVATVAGYLNREFYLPELKGFGSYAQWANRVTLDRSKTLDEVQVYLDSFPKVNKLLLLLSNRSSIKNLNPGESLYFDKFNVIADSKFENSFHDSEKFYLYWVERIVD